MANLARPKFFGMVWLVMGDRKPYPAIADRAVQPAGYLPHSRFGGSSRSGWTVRVALTVASWGHGPWSKRLPFVAAVRGNIWQLVDLFEGIDETCW
jgi:hypothetical protein